MALGLQGWGWHLLCGGETPTCPSHLCAGGLGSFTSSTKGLGAGSLPLPPLSWEL